MKKLEKQFVGPVTDHLDTHGIKAEIRKFKIGTDWDKGPLPIRKGTDAALAEMVPSRYNIFMAEKEGSGWHLVYNALSGSITRINDKLALALKSRDLAALEPFASTPLVESLKTQGILVNGKTNELEEYAKMHRRWKAGEENVEFNALLTYDCNFECPYCYQGRGEKGASTHGFRYMSPELLDSMMRFIKITAAERGARKLELVLYGGEPFLPGAREMGKELADEISRWSKENGVGFGLHVLSNGSMIDNEAVNWLSSHAARLQIPVDGAPLMHNRYRYYRENNRGSFDDIAKVLEMTKGTDIETHIRISLTDETCPTMDDLLETLKVRGLTHVYPDFCYITSFTDACADFAGHTLSDLKLFRIMPELWRKAHLKGFPLDIRPRIQPLPCSSVADGSYIVDPFGDVYKCWELVGLKEHIVGKIDRLGTLHRTEVYNDVLGRDPTRIIQCMNHSYLPTCGGGCVCKAQWQSKTYHAPGCGSEKYLLKDKIKVYVETLGLPAGGACSAGDFELRAIEGKQEPKMSHCYVLV